MTIFKAWDEDVTHVNFQCDQSGTRLDLTLQLEQIFYIDTATAYMYEILLHRHRSLTVIIYDRKISDASLTSYGMSFGVV